MRELKTSLSSKLNILIAIPYCKKETLEYIRDHKEIRFLLDSGAFTAWRAGKEIPLKDYCNFIDSLPLTPWNYFTLDKVGDKEGTKKNYEYLIKNGYKPIPIFTRGEDPEELEYYYENSEVVALGGLVGTRGNRGFVKGLMNKVNGRKTHWLGFNKPQFVSAYKPFSLDSSTWSFSLRYGILDLYCGRGQWKRLFAKDFIKRPDYKLLKLFEPYEEDPMLLRKAEEWRCVDQGGPNAVCLERVSYKSWAWYQIEVEKHLGTKFFLSAASFKQIQSFVRAHSFWNRLKFAPEAQL